MFFLILDNHVVFKVIISLQLFYNQIYCIHDCVLQASSEIENIPERVTNETRTTVSGMNKVVFLLFRNRLHADGCKFYFSKFLTLLLTLNFQCMISMMRNIVISQYCKSQIQNQIL